MDVSSPSARIVRTINQRLSLRPPQASSLEILDDVLGRIDVAKLEPAGALAAIQVAYPQVEDFERDFPSLCFALATGVGKTRLMGAFVSYLYLMGKSRHFFILAPIKRSMIS
jgi:type III restriction enzyme